MVQICEIIVFDKTRRHKEVRVLEVALKKQGYNYDIRLRIGGDIVVTTREPQTELITQFIMGYIAGRDTIELIPHPVGK